MMVASLVEEVDVKVRHLRPVRVGIVIDVLPVLLVAPNQPIVLWKLGAVTAPFEKITLRNAFELQVALRNRDLIRLRIKNAHQGLFAVGMAAQYPKGVMVACIPDPLQFVV